MSTLSSLSVMTLLRKRFGRFLGSVLLGGLLLLGACTSSKKTWKKIGQKDMQTILPQMLLAEALYDQRGIPDSVRILGYQTLLSSYGYGLSDWDSSLVWWGRNRIADYKSIYESAVTVLTAQQEALRRRVDSVTWIESRERLWQAGLRDSINLLPDSSSYHRLGTYLERSFAFTPNGPYTEGTEVRLDVRLAGLPRAMTGSSLRLSLQLLYIDSTAHTVELKGLHPGLNTLSYRIPAGKQMREAFGVLRGLAPRGAGKCWVVDSFSFARFSGMPDAPATEESQPDEEATFAPAEEALADTLAF